MNNLASLYREHRCNFDIDVSAALLFRRLNHHNLARLDNMDNQVSSQYAKQILDCGVRWFILKREGRRRGRTMHEEDGYGQDVLRTQEWLRQFQADFT